MQKSINVLTDFLLKKFIRIVRHEGIRHTYSIYMILIKIVVKPD
jgi:hypothetical protein